MQSLRFSNVLPSKRVGELLDLAVIRYVGAEELCALESAEIRCACKELFTDTSQNPARFPHTSKEGLARCLTSSSILYSHHADRLVLPLEHMLWQGHEVELTSAVLELMTNHNKNTELLRRPAFDEAWESNMFATLLDPPQFPKRAGPPVPKCKIFATLLDPLPAQMQNFVQNFRNFFANFLQNFCNFFAKFLQKHSVFCKKQLQALPCPGPSPHTLPGPSAQTIPPPPPAPGPALKPQIRPQNPPPQPTPFISKFCCSGVSKQGRIYFKLKYIAEAIFKRKEYGVI